MKVSIKTIKITSVISALSLVIALLMGAEYFKDASQIYLFGISWVTLQNTAFGIFGSAALAAVSAGIIYGVDKEAYLNKSEQYLIHVCTKSKTAFVQLTEANKILENGILSKNEKATFTGVSTIVSFIETQQEAIQPASMQFLFKRSQVASYNALLCRCHEVTQGLIQLSNKLQVKYGHWEINDAVKNAAQSSTGLDSPLLDEAKSCSEEDLRLTINQISWQLNNVIQYTTLAIHQLFYLQKKEDKLQSTFQLMDDQAQYYQKTLEVQAPTVDEKTIGKSVAKYTKSKDDIMYYAQELKENTYNLTRMNLVMRGIKPDNIFTRCGDTLEQDWPMYDDVTQEYNPLYLDAVVSNPPYSQRWDPKHKDTDPRYRYGIAPKGKADYAFLLHDLYHLKPDGIMTIVLPHGVLFRGDALGGPDGQGEGEGKIRRNLIENNNIEAIIGLPANIFFGTGIPTIIMVLRQKRQESDVLFIDASKGFTKVGKTNKLMASDIKRTVDAVAARPESVEKFARLVSKEEIRRNGYNLNIPRYIDSSEAPETWDIYATMFGGIPNHEIDLLASYWSAFPQLRGSLFASDETPYSQLAAQNVKEAIEGNNDVQAFIAAHQAAFADFDAYLNGELIEKMMELNISQMENTITQNIFSRIAPLPLLDKYQAYQLLDNRWGGIATDLEIIQTEDFDATKQVDPNMVIKKKGDKEEEVQSGWVGHVIPFELVQTTVLKADYDALKAKEARLDEIAAELTEIIDSIDEGDRGDFLNDDNTAFVSKEFAAKLAEIYGDVSSPELDGLQGYLELLDAKAGKAEKLHYVNTHPEVSWANVEGNPPYTKGKVLAYVKALRAAYIFPEDSFEAKMAQADKLMVEEKTVKSEVKKDAEALHLKTKETIEGLSDEQVLDLLRLKWIAPLCASLRAMPEAIIAGLEKAVQALADKYAVTYVELDEQIKASETALADMIDELTGSEFDMKGLSEFQSLLKGE